MCELNISVIITTKKVIYELHHVYSENLETILWFKKNFAQTVIQTVIFEYFVWFFTQKPILTPLQTWMKAICEYN